MNLTDVLRSMVEGIYGETSNDRLPEAFAIAPRYASLTGRPEFLYDASDRRFDDRKIFGKSVSASDKFVEDPFQLTTVTVDMTVHNSGLKVIPAVVAASMNVDVTRTVMRGLADQIYGGFVNEFLTVAAGELPNVGPFDISTPAAPAVSTIQGYIETIELASNKSPNTVWLSKQAAHRFMQLDEVQATTAIAGWTASANNVRRTGSATMGQLEAWFEQTFGLRLVVEPRTFIDSTGGTAYLGSDKMIICHAAEGAEDSALKTFHLGTYGGPNLISYRVQEANAPYPEGQILTASATYRVAATNPKAGLFVDLTI